MRRKILTGMLFAAALLAAGCGAKGDKTDSAKESPDLQQIETETQTDSEIQTDSYEQLGDDNLFSSGTTYTWQEITVSIPDAWEDRYQVEETEDGFALMQKASYEKEEGMGLLCSFGRIDGMVIDYAGVTPLAFSAQ